jgi:hypothetical protein
MIGMAGGRKIGALAVGAVVGVMGVTVAATLLGSPQREAVRTERPKAAGTPEPLVGAEYAESLGLPVMKDLSAGGCQYAAEEPVNETLYCMDSVADSTAEARLIGMQINGRVPTEADERLVALVEELHAIPDTDENQARRNELMDQIVELKLQIDPTAAG